MLETCAQVVRLAADKGEPLVVEQLESESPRRCRQLSSFFTGLKRAASIAKHTMFGMSYN
ncbi:MAG: hypothetical protein NZ482_08605 [Gloeomargarita sp. SKYG98]|nr:hypothetical protein [Gloeomargarita sp. SKYG98]